ncbi:MAG: FG-GAP-like repeat-containing protein [Isosphaeraceae bacterium]|nr:FG-GAP-like repeat-containing protein [Isosphaeraceae bacterium]
MRARLIGLALVAASIAGATWWFLESRESARVESELKSIEAEIVAGRSGTARWRLDKLLESRPSEPRGLYLLGVLDWADGRRDAARRAWSNLGPNDAPWFALAALPLAESDRAEGRLEAAETRLRAALASAGEHEHRVRWALAELLAIEGRTREAVEIYRDALATHPDSLEALRSLYKLEHDPYPAESIRVFLETAEKREPNDKRVALGLAINALKRGDLETAEPRLAALRASTPDDPAVLEAELEWAIAAGRPDVLARDLAALSDSPRVRSYVDEIALWSARRRGDRRDEGSRLDARLEAAPRDVVALEAAAALALEQGNPARAAELRRRREEVERDRAAYLRLLGSSKVDRPDSEVAALAAQGGLAFDAALWSAPGATLREKAARLRSERAEVRLGIDRELLAELASIPSERRLDRVRKTASFVDRAADVGLAFEHTSEAAPALGRRLTPPITMCGGVALLDANGDGRLDVYAVQGGIFPSGSASTPGDRLFVQDASGRFADATDRAGLAAPGRYGHGVAVGDFDSDGRPDLFVTRWRSYALYRNRGDGTFEDVTAQAGLGGDRDWPTSAAFADLDGDGDLDLYVAHYLKWSDDDPRACVDPKDPSIYNCSPKDFDALPDHLFRNDAGRFVDVTAQAGIVDRDGRGLGVVAADLDGDRLVDLFVANDMSANYFFRNLGGMRFEEIALSAGVAANASGGYQAGMGAACDDLDGDGLPDIAVTNFYNESTTLFRNLGGGSFADRTAEVGLAAPSRFLLGFGAAFLDVDADGWNDLMTTNGHIHDSRPRVPYEMPLQLLMGIGEGRLVDVSRSAGPPFQVARLGRGLATGDLDGDGRIDAVVLARNAPLAYLHNETTPSGRALSLELQGVRSNRDAVGAVVVATVAGRRITRFRIGGGSYQSASAGRIHIGLGAADKVDSVEVRWPAGGVDLHRDLAAGRYRLVEGSTEPSPVPIPFETSRFSP